MDWTTFDSDVVLGQFTEAERDEVQALDGGGGKLADATSKALKEWRQAMTDGGFELGDAGTLPEGYHARAAAIAVWLFVTSLSGAEQMQTEARKELCKDARSYEQLIATGRIKPANATPVPQVASELLRDPGASPFAGLGTT